MSNVASWFRRFIAAWRSTDSTTPSELHVAIMRVHRVQTWFQHHRGVAMTRRKCEACGTERMFTIWGDGRYYCLPCLYQQVEEGRPGPVPMATGESAKWDFVATWLAYKRRVETLDEPWSPTGSAVIRLARIGRVPPPPICAVAHCEMCEGLRPHMPLDEGGACIYCLMHGRVVEIELVDDEHAAA